MQRTLRGPDMKMLGPSVLPAWRKRQHCSPWEQGSPERLIPLTYKLEEVMLTFVSGHQLPRQLVGGLPSVRTWWVAQPTHAVEIAAPVIEAGPN